MENFNLAVGLISSLLVLLGSVVGMIISLVNLIKSKKIVLDKEKVGAFLIEAIKDAETMIGASGEEKKKAVMEKYQKFVNDNKIAINLEEVNESIENIIAYSKFIASKK